METVFAIIGFDSQEGQNKRPLYRPHHLERLRALEQKGKLILAGPFTDGAGSLILMKANSLSEAEEFAKGDPYSIHGVFERVSIHPFKQVLPESPSP